MRRVRQGGQRVDGKDGEAGVSNKPVLMRATGGLPGRPHPAHSLPPTQPRYLSSSVALPEEQLILNDTLLPWCTPGEPNAGL